MDKRNSIPDHAVSGILPIDVGEQKTFFRAGFPEMRTHQPIPFTNLSAYKGGVQYQNL